LLALDRAAGLDFRVYLNFINDRPWLIHILSAAYCAITLPIWLIVIALPLTGHYRRTAEFISAFMVSLIATTLISTLIPATGVYGTIGFVQADFPAWCRNPITKHARDSGPARRLAQASQSLGIGWRPDVSEFSCHLGYSLRRALWPLRWLRPFNLACNGAMLVCERQSRAALFCDVIAGAAMRCFQSMACVASAFRLTASQKQASSISQVAAPRTA